MLRMECWRRGTVVPTSASKWNACWGSSLCRQHDEEERQWYWWWQANDMPQEAASEHMQHFWEYDAVAVIPASKSDTLRGSFMLCTADAYVCISCAAYCHLAHSHDTSAEDRESRNVMEGTMVIHANSMLILSGIMVPWIYAVNFLNHKLQMSLIVVTKQSGTYCSRIW